MGDDRLFQCKIKMNHSTLCGEYGCYSPHSVCFAHALSQQKVMNSFFWTYGRYAFDVVKGFEKNRVVTLLSVVPLKIGKITVTRGKRTGKRGLFAKYQHFRG